MKIKPYLVVILYMITLSLLSQNLTDVARCKEMTWYGIDFSKARFIGFSDNELDSIDIFEWDLTNLTGKEKATITDYYGKKSIDFVTEYVHNQNTNIRIKNQVSDKSYYLKIDTIVQLVNEYKFKKEGYGILGVVETVEKNTNSIYIYMVYINNETGKIISSIRYKGGGFVRDNRIGPYYNVRGVKLITKISGKDLKKYAK